MSMWENCHWLWHSDGLVWMNELLCGFDMTGAYIGEYLLQEVMIHNTNNISESMP